MLSKKAAAEKLDRYEELKAQKKAIDAELDEIEGDLKNELARRGVEFLEVGDKIVRWTEVLSARFDTTKFKKAFPELYKEYTKQIPSRRFSVS